MDTHGAAEWRQVPSLYGNKENRYDFKLFTKLSVSNLKGYKEDNSFELEIKPMLNVLRAMGVLPLQKSQTEFQFALLSPIMMYSACVYGGMLALLWLVHGHELQSEHYDDAILAIYHLVLLLLVLFIPVTNWRDAPTIASLVSSWTRLQAEFRTVTGEQLMLSLRKQSLFFAVVVPGASILLELCYQLLDTSMNIMQLISDIYLLTLRILLAVLWYLCCLALVQTAEKTLIRFREALAAGVLARRVVIQYRILWFKLAKQTRRTGLSMCYTFGFFILYMFMKLTLNIYWTLNALLFVPSKLFVLMYVGITIITDITMMVIFCDNAQLVHRKIGNVFRDFLMDYRTSTQDQFVDEEVYTFLHTIETVPPDLNLGDYVTVNRSLLISMGSVMVTYLVVLLQFKMSNLSMSANNSTETNGTSNYTQFLNNVS